MRIEHATRAARTVEACIAEDEIEPLMMRELWCDVCGSVRLRTKTETGRPACVECALGGIVQGSETKPVTLFHN